MPKDTKTLCIKKGCASVLTHLLLTYLPFLYYKFNPDSTNFYFKVYNKRGGRL